MFWRAVVMDFRVFPSWSRMGRPSAVYLTKKRLPRPQGVAHKRHGLLTSSICSRSPGQLPTEHRTLQKPFSFSRVDMTPRASVA